MQPAAQMIEVRVPDTSALGARVVISPLLTLAMALMDALGDRPPTPWRQLLRVRTRGLDSTPLAMFARPAFMLPNGLLPLPIASPRSFDDELSALRAAPTEQLRRDLGNCLWPVDELPAELAPFATDPVTALACYCDALEAHWTRMLRPSWPRMSRLLEREVLLAGCRMAAGGVDGMLAGLHPQLSYDDRCLRYCTGAVTHTSYVAHQTLTLAPVACEADLLLVNEDHPDATVIAYAARGSAELWGEGRRPPAAELAALLGPTRATIALALETPATTSALADRLDLAASTVSRHLGGLLATGLADRVRRGPLVYYRLTARGTALLDLF